MSRPEYKERVITLVSEVQRGTLLALLPNLPIDPSKPIEVVIREKKKVRKLDQNALYWVGPLRDISEQAWLDGKQFSAETWAFFFKKEFLPEDDDQDIAILAKDGYQKWDFTPDGERFLSGSSTQLTVFGFSQYLEKIMAFGANLGVKFSASKNEVF